MRRIRKKNQPTIIFDQSEMNEKMPKQEHNDEFVDRPSSIVARFFIGLIRFYQKAISPMIGPCCRFTPSCSQYFILAIQKYGVFYGSMKGFWRILRCNPFCKGGEDLP